MNAILDLFKSERGFLGLALLLGGTVLAAIGKMPIDQWQEFSLYVFGIYVAGKTVSGTVTALRDTAAAKADEAANKAATPNPTMEALKAQFLQMVMPYVNEVMAQTRVTVTPPTAEEIAAYEKMTPEQRAAYDAERGQSPTLFEQAQDLMRKNSKEEVAAQIMAEQAKQSKAMQASFAVLNPEPVSSLGPRPTSITPINPDDATTQQLLRPSVAAVTPTAAGVIETKTITLGDAPASQEQP